MYNEDGVNLTEFIISKIYKYTQWINFKIYRFLEIAKNRGLLYALNRAWEFILLSGHRIRAKYIRALYDKNARDRLFWDEDYRYGYDLSEDDIVFDLGGYKGEFTERLLKDHTVGTAHIFEPVEEFAQQINAKHENNHKVIVHEYGLGDSNRRAGFNVNGPSSTLCSESVNKEVEIRDIVEVIEELDIDEIKLMKVNIEVAEYELLERVIDSGYISLIQNIQVQFHNIPGIENCKHKHAIIQEKLRKSHDLQYEYYFTWESWSLAAKSQTEVNQGR